MPHLQQKPLSQYIQACKAAHAPPAHIMLLPFQLPLSPLTSHATAEPDAPHLMRKTWSSTSSTARSGVEAPEVTPMVRGPSRSQGRVSCSSPCASLCEIELASALMHPAELTQKEGSPAVSGISCGGPGIGLVSVCVHATGGKRMHCIRFGEQQAHLKLQERRQTGGWVPMCEPIPMMLSSIVQ